MSWPVQGPVLRPFVYDEAHPYAAGQHRGIDIGASGAGENVVAPAAGTVSFAGTVPTNGKSITIVTADGYSVTLTHLGSILVAKGAAVAERDAIATIGPSGTPEFARPYVHLGIRHTADADGYLDPLEFLPPVSDGGATEGDPAASQPGASGSSSATPAPTASTTPPARTASQPVHSRTGSRSVSTGRGSTSAKAEGRSSRQTLERAQEQSNRSLRRPAEEATARTVRPADRRVRVDRLPKSSVRRPVVEPAAPVEPSGLDAGHEIRPNASAPQPSDTRPATPAVPLPLVLNGAAAVLALAAALLAARSRRIRHDASAVAAAQVLHLPRPEATHRPASRAA